MSEEIDASPTKELFISLLTKDIGLSRALLDLVDNSVDAARTIHEKKLDGFEIHITISEYSFEIWDNCGGMSRDTALKYAFKFGRDENTPFTKHSVGRFGVGMKRTLFKLGKTFHLSSYTEEDAYSVDVNVDEWKAQEYWKFKLIDSERPDKSQNGVKISVDLLYENISKEFKDVAFIDGFKHELELAHFIPIKYGLKITLNGDPIENHIELSLFESEIFSPIVLSKKIGDVSIRIYCGVTERNKHDAGWYVFCNERLILSNDQSKVTGWGNGCPSFHEDFARFRGYIFFDSDDPSLLPWTSTKTNLDKEAPVYQGAIRWLVEATKPVLNRLRSLARVKTFNNRHGEGVPEAEEALINASSQDIFKLKHNDTFIFPETRVPSEDPLTTITIKKSRDIIEDLKQQYDIDSNKELGELMFTYFLESEGFEDEKAARLSLPTF